MLFLCSNISLYAYRGRSLLILLDFSLNYQGERRRMSYIEFKNVSKAYGSGRAQINATREASFQIEKGELVVILGPSGAGKTTILNMLGGMDKPSSGEIWVNGTRISDYNDKELTYYRRDRVGFVFQFYNLIPNLTALENVEMSEQITDTSKKSANVLAQVGLEERAVNFPAQLSGGEQQRVSIARALVKEPDLLLCDEPTGALDNETGQQVLQLLQNEAYQGDSTVIIITHNSAIAKMADRVIEIDSGTVENMYVQRNPLSVDEIEW